MSPSRPFTFFATALLFSHVPWVFAALFGFGVSTFPGKLLVALGGLGPALSALGMLLLFGDRELRRDYLRRLVDVRRIPPNFWGVIFLLPPGTVLLSMGMSLFFGGSLRQFVPVEEALRSIPSAMAFGIFVLFFGPLPEELGWRGYGLPGILERTDWIRGSVVTATVWAVWHAPLFFIPGYPLAPLAENPVGTAAYFLDFFPNSLLYTWIFIETGRSILGAILFHFSGNLWGMLFETGPAADAAGTVVKFVLAGTVILCRGPAGPRGDNR